MRWRRRCLAALALVLAQVLALDLSWLYRFVVRDACPPVRSCFGWNSPWERFCDWLACGRLAELPALIYFRYEWREVITLLAVAGTSAVALVLVLDSLGALRWRIRLRTALLIVALAAFQWAGIRALWTTVDDWEYVQMRNHSFCCLDTWIWGEDL